MSHDREAERAEAMEALAKAKEMVERARLRVIAAGGPTHVNGIRDPDSPCAEFVLGDPDASGTCQTDGHYVCDECIHRATCDGGCGRRPAQCECPDGPLGPKTPTPPEVA